MPHETVGFLTREEFRQSLADTLKVSVSDLGSNWDRQCEEAMRSAYLDIRGALVQRGFTAAQVLAWERGAEFQRDIGHYWALVRSGAAVPMDDRILERLDRRKELMTVVVEIDTGVPQAPAYSPPRVQVGKIGSVDSDGNEDFWTKDTPV